MIKILIRKWVLMIVFLALSIMPMLSVAAREDLVHLVLWHAAQGAQAEALQASISAFQKLHPTITIAPIYYSSAALQSTFTQADIPQPPDMILAASDQLGVWVSDGLLKDLSITIPEALKSQASATAWGLFQFKDGLYGVPYSAQTLAFFYNTALVPAAPPTWADVLSSARQIHNDHPNVTGLAFQNGFFQSAGFLFALGGQLMDFDGNATFGDNGDGAAAMNTYLQFQQDMHVLGQDASSGVIVDASSPNPGFSNGTVAMIYDGLWNLAGYEIALGDKLGVSTMPMLDNGVVPALFAQGEGFYLSAKADDAKTLAFIEWGKFVTSVAGQTIAVKQGNLLPVNPALRLDNPHLQTFADQFALGTPFPNRQEIGQFWGPVSDAIMAVTAGSQSPDQARHDAYTFIQKALDDLHGVTPEATAAAS